MLKPRRAVLTLPVYEAPSPTRTGLNLDLNENTGGCSPRVLQKLASLTTMDLARYADRESGEKLVARFLHLAPEQVLLTNGVDEGLQMLSLTYLSEGDEAIVLDPTFNMYAIDVAATSATLVPVTCNADFSFPVESILASVNAKTRLIAIANPNNPTGIAARREDLIRVLEAASDIAVLIDEAYFEFYGETVIDLLPKYGNLFVARTFSKAYGLAGLRIGALMGNAEQIGYVRRLTPPYNVNVAALACLLAAISDQPFVANYLRGVFEGRMKLQSLFAAQGLQYWPSSTNFVLARIGEKHAEFVSALALRGFQVRDRGNDPGCIGCVRITIGTPEQNEQLLAAVEAAIAELKLAKQVTV